MLSFLGLSTETASSGRDGPGPGEGEERKLEVVSEAPGLQGKIDGDDNLAALHTRFRADLDAAPLDELREAAQTAACANVGVESAGGWKLHVTASVSFFFSENSPKSPRVASRRPSR
jgi:hypothetical protein